jgi:hypothetical protein
MAKATQLCVALNNEPGTLAKLCGTLRRAKVNIEAVTLENDTECGWVRVIASPLAEAKAALTKGRFNFCTQRVLRLKVTNRPGELERISGQLAAAGVNINYVYGSNAEGASGTLILSVNNPDKAMRVLGP